MSVGQTERCAARRREVALLDRTFEAFVFDWDGTAVADRRADATRARSLIEVLCAGASTS